MLNPVLISHFEHVQTERLILRTPRNEDIEAVFAIHGDPETNRFNPNGPMKSIDEAIERVEQWLQDWERNGFGYWSILSSHDCEIIGFGGLRRIQWAGRDVLNLYYRLSTKSWGKGYATELAQTAVDLARRYLPEFPVVARIHPTNSASIRVAERVGLKHMPELDTSEYMILTIGW
jgi:[ribosomal protein S5]-alanine N-acetyltransferase